MASKLWPLTEKYITNYGNQVEAEILTRLAGHKKYASGTLHDSIGYKLTTTDTGFLLGFFMIGYGFWVDKGSKPSTKYPSDGGGTGKSPFIQSLFKWCAIKGLPKGAAFAIRRNIWKRGQPPTNFFTIPIKRRAAQFEKGYGNAMAQDIDKLLQKEINASKK